MKGFLFFTIKWDFQQERKKKKLEEIIKGKEVKKVNSSETHDHWGIKL